MWKHSPSYCVEVVIGKQVSAMTVVLTFVPVSQQDHGTYGARFTHTVRACRNGLHSADLVPGKMEARSQKLCDDRSDGPVARDKPRSLGPPAHAASYSNAQTKHALGSQVRLHESLDDLDSKYPSKGFLIAQIHKPGYLQKDIVLWVLQTCQHGDEPYHYCESTEHHFITVLVPLAKCTWYWKGLTTQAL